MVCGHERSPRLEGVRRFQPATARSCQRKLTWLTEAWCPTGTNFGLAIVIAMNKQTKCLDECCPTQCATVDCVVQGGTMHRPTLDNPGRPMQFTLEHLTISMRTLFTCSPNACPPAVGRRRRTT